MSPLAATIRERIRALDWRSLERSLWQDGFARAGPILTEDDCESLVGLYDDDARFRTRIDMERHRFGRGDYAYFANPLPASVRQLRTHAYRALAPIAERWSRTLGRDAGFPASLRGFLELCHSRGQRRPTPLLLRYAQGGYNRLHQDVYGDLLFPLQLAVLLSRPGRDFAGGEFLLLDQPPRTQPRAEVIRLTQGELIVFPSAERPLRGRRGWLRSRVRHGAGRVTSGSRYVLGIIFHDAR